MQLKSKLHIAEGKEITTTAIVTACLVVYVLGTAALAALALLYEKDTILFTKPKKTVSGPKHAKERKKEEEEEKTKKSFADLVRSF